MHTICLLMQRDSFYAAEINARSQAATGRSEMTGGTTSRISTKTGIRGLSVSHSRHSISVLPPSIARGIR